MQPSRVLAALADLAPAGRERTLDVAKGEQPIVWLDDPDPAPRNRTVDRRAKDETPVSALPGDELLGQAIAALYVVRDVSSAGLRDTLRAWAARTGLEFTALAHVYGGDDLGTAALPARGDGNADAGVES